jgi:hypothetical protein
MNQNGAKLSDSAENVPSIFFPVQFPRIRGCDRALLPGNIAANDFICVATSTPQVFVTSMKRIPGKRNMARELNGISQRRGFCHDKSHGEFTPQEQV